MSVVEFHQVHEDVLSFLMVNFKNQGINFLSSNFISQGTRVRASDLDIKSILECIIHHSYASMKEVPSKLIKITANENLQKIIVEIVHNGVNDSEGSCIFSKEVHLSECQKKAEAMGGKLYQDLSSEKVKFVLELPKLILCP